MSMTRLNSLRWKGYFYDVETGLYFINGRWYDPETCRYLSPSNHSTLATGVLGQNSRYSYANNNPVGIAYSSSSASASDGSVYLGYHDMISSYSNILGSLGALSSAFGLFDQWSSYISGGLDGGLKFLGPKGFGFNRLGGYSELLDKFGKGMAITGAVFSLGSSVYNNFTNVNYSTGEAIGASIMDAAYYGITSRLKYKAGIAIGNFAINAGMAVGAAAVGLAGAIGLGFTGSLVVGLVTGGIVAIGIAVLGAVAIYCIGEMLDYVWSEFKKALFE